MNVIELEDNTEQTSCYKMNLNESKRIQLSVDLVKKETPEADDIRLELLRHQVRTIKSETVSTDDKFKSPSSHTCELKDTSRWSLELKPEMCDQDDDVESDKNVPIKKELLHEELDIKSEDETIQDSNLHDKYDLETQLQKPKIIPCRIKCFKCNICDYSSARANDLKSHLRTHSGEKPFKCNICDNNFGYKSHLKNHLRIHSGEKPFKCTICGYSSVQNSTLKRHLATHSGDKHLKCNICHYSSAHSGALKIHLRSHTGERPFQCNICAYSFVNKSNLKDHSRIHTGEKPFKCNICDYSSGQSGTLKRHLKTHIIGEAF